MELEFDRAKWSVDGEGAWLMVGISSPGAVTPWLEQMRSGRRYTAKLDGKRNRRSLDANGYYWALCGELARKMDLEPEEVYRRHIRGLGNYAVYGMKAESVSMFARLWVSGHLGRMIETRESRLPGIVNVLAWYGSSDFDTGQMARLIDHAVQDCRALGIETRPKEEIDSLLGEWDAKRDKTDEHTKAGA